MQGRSILMVSGIFLLAAGLWGCTQGVKTELKYAQADIAMMRGEYAQATDLLVAYVAAKPDAVDARVLLGVALMKTGRLEEAEGQFRAALDMRPGDPPAVLNLGLTLLKQDRVPEAVAVLRGFDNPEAPEITAEIKRQLTSILIAHSRQLAARALAEEKLRTNASAAPNTVAVCYYKDLSTDQRMRAYQKGLAAMVISDLSKITTLRVLERLRLQALLEEMQLGQTGIVDEKTAPRVGMLLEVENVVVGSLSPGSIIVATAVDGRASGTASAAVEEQRFFQLPMIIARDVANILGIVLTVEQQAAIGKPHTRNFEAFLFYGQGLDALDQGNWQGAADYFLKALALDPRFDLAAEAAASCPPPDAPPISRLAFMTGPQLALQVEGSMERIQQAQKKADLENVGDARGGKEGDGGGGGH